MQRWDSLDALLAHARSHLDRVTPSDLADEIRDGALVIDVRDSAQRDELGTMPGAHAVDLTVLEWRLAPSSAFRTFDVGPGQRVILVCRDGYSSSLAALRLQELGVPGATDLEGGFTAWAAWMSGASGPHGDG
jgi:rhodanese-related sulfurtransferase